MSTADPYLTPFTWRYGSPEMRKIWSERTTRLLWRRIWVALARVQSRYGLVNAAQLADLETHVEEVDLSQSRAVESEIHHDVMAEVTVYANQCPTGGGIIHLGATSMDVKDNASALQVRQALDLVIARLDDLLQAFAEQIERWADTICMAYTHLQPAEPTTLGYRLALYAQDLLEDRADLIRARDNWRGKGMKGAVGTSASYALLLDKRVEPAEFEAQVMAEIGLPSWSLANQTYPRRQDWAILNHLAGLGSTLYRFAMDLRVLQTPAIGEWAEPFREKQVGSSAMPFKRNPIEAEKIDSLARYLAQIPRIAWDNAALSLLERTLDDSANRRIILPEAFLTADEIIRSTTILVRGLRVNQLALSHSLTQYGSFAGIEALLMRLAQAGADRQVMHGFLRQIALQAWREIEAGRENTLPEMLAAQPELQRFLTEEEIHASLDVTTYVGDAPQRALALAKVLRTTIDRK